MPTDPTTVKQYGDTTLFYGAAGLTPTSLSIGKLKSLQKRVSSAVNATATDQLGNVVAQVVSSTPDVTYTLTLTVARASTPPVTGDLITIEGAKSVITEVSVNYSAENFAEYSITAERKGTVDYNATATINSDTGYPAA